MNYSDKQIKMAYGIINDPRYKGGNMTEIVKKIEQIAKGLSKHPGVKKAMKVTNEDTIAEAKEHPAYKNLMDLAKIMGKAGDRDTRAIQDMAGKIANFTATGNRGVIADLGKAFKALDSKARDAFISVMQKHDKSLLKSIASKAGISINEAEELDEGVKAKYWTVTVTKSVNKLKKGQTTRVKASTIQSAIMRAASSFGEDPKLVGQYLKPVVESEFLSFVKTEMEALDEARSDAPKGDKKTTNENPLITIYDDEFKKGRPGISGHMNLTTFMGIHAISKKFQKDLAKMVLKAGVGKKVKLSGKVVADYEQEYRDEDKEPHTLWIELSDGHEKSMNEGDIEINEANMTNKAAKALWDYGTNKGGIDKKFFQGIAGNLENFMLSGNKGVIANAAKTIKGMDTDPRDKALEIIMKHDAAVGKTIMFKAGLK